MFIKTTFSLNRQKQTVKLRVLASLPDPINSTCLLCISFSKLACVSPHHLYLYLNLAEGGHRSYATGQRYGVYPHHLYRYYSANSSAGYAQQYGNLSCSRSSIATGGSRTKGIGQWLDENGFESREKGRGFFDSWVGTTSSEPIVPNHGYFVDTFMSLRYFSFGCHCIIKQIAIELIRFSARFRHRNA
ncbi:hypothetical protein HanIR_Chr05g0213401 [Helianthus annuus]|nr:hypothetical protein HanIR_Chr05g0213401 [Helianthus annuus]